MENEFVIMVSEISGYSVEDVLEVFANRDIDVDDFELKDADHMAYVYFA